MGEDLMPRFLLIVFCAAGLLAGCSKKQPGPEARKTDPATKPTEDPEARRKLAEAREKEKRKNYDAALAAAQQAHAEKKYDEAIKHFQAALALIETEAALAGLKKAREDRDRIRDRQRREDYRLAMDAGRNALKTDNYRGAVNSFSEALRLRPGDTDAAAQLRLAQQPLARQLHQQGAAHMDGKRYAQAVVVLTEANQLDPTNAALATLLMEARRLDDLARNQREKQEQFAKLMSTARVALNDLKYAEAVKHYEAALVLYPTDRDARQGLEKAKTAAARQRARDYKAAMDAAREARRRQDHQAAINAFTRALQLVPGDKDAQGGLLAAQGARKKSDFEGFMARGKTAMTEKRFAEAVKHFEGAVALFPTDAEARKNLDAAKKASDGSARLDRDFARAMQAGKAALTAGKMDEAAKAFNAALVIKPNDAAARAGLNNALASARKQQDFKQLMTRAREASAMNKHSDAARLYTEALKIFPKDTAAKKGLDDATRADAAGKKRRQEDYKLALDAGRDAVKKRNWLGAVNSYKAALVALPGDKTAQEALRIAESRLKEEFDRLKGEGKKSAAAKRFADAVKHYEAALKLKPNDPEVTAALKRARAGKP
jgi:tetratricopeptide (TPR) repeat protein